MKKTAEGKHLLDDASNYDDSKFKNPSVTIDFAVCTIIDDDLKVFLIKRKYPPFRGCWAIPGGFVDIDQNQTLEETARRELREETGIKNGIYLEQLKTYGDPDRDPRKRIITVAYFALVPFNSFPFDEVKADDDAEDAKPFSLTALPKVGFDHKKILDDLLKRLRGKISYTPIAFNLLNKRFTWSELQKVYEIILGRRLVTPNFRRKINSMYKISQMKERKKRKIQGRRPVYLKFNGMKEL